MKRISQAVLLTMAILSLAAALTGTFLWEGSDDIMLFRDRIREIYLDKGHISLNAYEDGGIYLDAMMKNIYRNEIWVDVMEYSTWHIDPVNMRYKVSEITSCNLDGETLET